MSGMEQAYLEKMFPNGRELPPDRLIPCLLMKERQTEVVFLIKTSSAETEMLRTENDPQILSTDISVIAVEKEAVEHPDLRICLELAYPERMIRFQGAIADAEGKKQAAVAKALLLVNRVALFVATHNFEFISFKAFDWDPASQPTLENILRNVSQD